MSGAPRLSGGDCELTIRCHIQHQFLFEDSSYEAKIERCRAGTAPPSPAVITELRRILLPFRDVRRVSVSRELVDHSKLELADLVAAWGHTDSIGFEISLKLGRAVVVVIIVLEFVGAAKPHTPAALANPP